QAKTIEEGNWLWLAAILVGAFVLSMIAGNGVDKAYHPVNAILERFSTGKFAVDEIAKGPAAEMVLRLTDLGHILQAKFAAKKAEAKPTGSSLASHLRHTLIPQTDIKRPGLT